MENAHLSFIFMQFYVYRPFLSLPVGSGHQLWFQSCHGTVSPMLTTFFELLLEMNRHSAKHTLLIQKGVGVHIHVLKDLLNMCKVCIYIYIHLIHIRVYTYILIQ